MFEVCAKIGGEFHPIITVDSEDAALNAELAIITAMGEWTVTTVKQLVA